MTLYVWPWRLLRARRNKGRLGGRVIQGPPSISGQAPTGRTDGGGLWILDALSISLRNPDHIRAARAWSAHLDGGVTEFIYPLWDLGQAPRPFAGGKFALPGAPAVSDDYFGQEPGFGEPMMAATLAASAALRATSVQIAVSNGGPLRGGEYFSLNHAVLGWRLYVIGRVTGVAGSAYTVEVRPPLREAAGNGAAVELDMPRCTVKLVPGQAGDLDPEIDLGRFATVDLHMMESF